MKGFGIQVIDNNDKGTILDIKIDPIRNAKGQIVSGFVLGNTLEQNKAFLLIAEPGDLRGYPLVGVGFRNVLLSDELLEYRHKIREQFALDGLKVTELDLYQNKPVKIIAHYE